MPNNLELIQNTEARKPDGKPPIRFTPAQEAAITAEKGPLLVSAAAGSGKTAVLCERILRKLTRKEDPAELSRMLIVTFTRAAAEELKFRLSDKLKDALLRDPGNRHLRRQIAALPGAKICTIHSFCFDILRRNYQTLGLSASLRILDEQEGEALSRRVMDDCIDFFYSGDRRESFEQLTDGLVDTRDDTLSKTLVSIYNRLCAEPKGVGAISDCAEELRGFADGDGVDFFSIAPGRVIKEGLLRKLRYFDRLYTFALEIIESCESAKEAYGPAYAADKAYIGRLLSAADAGMEELRDLISSPPKPRCSSLKKEYQDAEILYCKEIRESFFGYLKDKKSIGLSFSKEELQKILRLTADRLFTLARIEEHFSRELEKEKKRLSAVDFNDIERLTAALLTDDSGGPTALAAELAERFDEVCVDEYQDVNTIQDLIFRRIAPQRRFMVGDVKQSIYGFRGARPEIFSAYRDRFLTPEEYADAEKFTDTLPSAGESSEERGIKLFLSENFRCDSRIINFSNAIFRTLFGASRSIRYVPEDDLRHGKTGEDRLLPVELWICDDDLTPALTLAGEDSSCGQEKKESPDAAEESVAEETDGVKYSSEAALVAARVEALLREGRAPEDIAILVRSMKLCEDELTAAFAARGIGLNAGSGETFHRLPEILLLQSLLEAIDNPLRDISLVSAMKSPLFDFTLSELAALRKDHPKGPFYYAVKEAVSESGDAETTEKGEKSAQEDEKEPLPALLKEKCGAFLAFLEKYRRLNASISPDRLILRLLTEYSLLPMLTSDLDEEEAAQCRLSVMKYYDLARGYTERGRSGLSGFLFQMEKRSRSEKKEKHPTGAVPGKVQLMTVHNAKGLEFPVCIFYGCGKSFSKQKGDFFFDDTLGPAITLQDESGYGKIFTPQMTAVKLKADAEDLEEEMRVLYVALTRAKEQLIITGKCRDSESLRRMVKLDSATLSRATFESGKNRDFLHWILLCLADPKNERLCEIHQSEDAAVLQARLSGDGEGSAPNSAEDRMKEADSPAAPQTDHPTPSESEREALFARLSERLAFRYPYKEETRLPAKLSVSRLWPDILDGDAEAGKDLLRSNTTFTHPVFLEEEASPAGAAERGSATHTFMQFCSFDGVAAAGVEKELERLIEKKFLSPHAASLVDRRALSVFFASEVFGQMQSAPLLRREQRFNILLPASWFTTEEEKKTMLAKERLLVQGVIDCFFETKEGKLWLLDYKTDHFPKATSKEEIEEAERTLVRRHRRQMTYYRAALEKICRRQVDVVALWSFSLGKTVILRDEDTQLPESILSDDPD